MSIEKDIQQQKFKSEYQKAMINLIYTFNWVTEKLKKIFEKEDLTPQQYNILRILRGSDKPLSTLEIRARMLDKMSDTSRIVDRLIKKNLVKKATCAADKRLVDVSINQNGLLLLQNLDKYENEMEAILNQLTIPEAQMLNTLFDKIRKSE